MQCGHFMLKIVAVVSCRIAREGHPPFNLGDRMASAPQLKPEIEAHLKQVEEPIRAAHEVLSRHEYPDDLRTVIVIALIDQMRENHEAMLLLIRSGKIGSAFALARSVVEGMYRGLWVNFCAKQEEIERFEREDKFPLPMPDLADAIDEKYQAGGFFEDLKKRGWATLCSYAHNGMLQLGRRFTGHKLEPSYTDGQILEVTTTVTTCILMLAGKFLAVQGHAEDSRQAEKLIESYGPLVPRPGSPAA